MNPPDRPQLLVLYGTAGERGAAQAFAAELREAAGLIDVKVSLSSALGIPNAGVALRIDPAGILYTQLRRGDCDRIVNMTIAGGVVAEVIKAWTNGGPTTITNCVPLCGPHNAQNDDNPDKHWHNGHAIKDPATGRVGWQFTRGGPIYHNKNPLIRKGMREWALAHYGFISMTPINK